MCICMYVCIYIYIYTLHNVVQYSLFEERELQKKRDEKRKAEDERRKEDRNIMLYSCYYRIMV